MQFNPTNYPIVTPAPLDTVLLRQRSNGRVKSATVASIAASASPIKTADTIADLQGTSVDDFSGGELVQVKGYYADGDGGGGLFLYSADSADTPNDGTIFAPDSGTGRWIRQYSGSADVRWFGCVGDGTTDDTSRMQVAMKTGLDLYIPHGNFLVRSVLDPRSGQLIHGGGDQSLFTFHPISAPHDRLFRVASDSMSSLKTITSGAIALGDTSFVSDASGVSDLSPGDWLFIQETDHPVAVVDDICNCDWMRVESIVGNTINTTTQFRVAFSGTHFTYGFRKIIDVNDGTILRDFKIRTVANGNEPLGISVTECLNTVIDNVTIDSIGDYRSLFSYRAKGLKFTNCRFLVGAPEIAATVDWVGSGNTLGSYETPIAEAISIDMGSAFFSYVNNQHMNAENIGILCLFGVHDGVIGGNSVSWVDSPDANLGDGVALGGCHNIACVGNTLSGGENNGATTGNAGFTSNDQAMVGANLLSYGNIFVGNMVTGFLNRYVIAATDTYLDSNGGLNTGLFSGAFKGTTTNDSAAAGYVGQYLSSVVLTGSAVALTDGIPVNVTSISLTAGDWDVEGTVYFNHSAQLDTGVARTATVSASGFSGDGSSGIITSPSPGTFISSVPAPTYRYSLSATTTIYLCAFGGFASGTASAFGAIRARRMR